MAWRMTFTDGPLAEETHERMVMGGLMRVAYFAPLPTERRSATHDGWMLVGFEGLEPEPPWPGQVAYELDDEASEVRTLEQPGEDQGVAVYRLVTT